MITSIIRYHTAIYYIMSITHDRFRPYWVSSGGCKKHSIINMLKKTNLPLGAKKCNTKHHDTAIPISWGSHSRTHTHDMDSKSHRQALIGVRDHCQDLSLIHELLVASQQFSRQSPIKRDLPPASICNRKICSNMITSIIRYHTAIYYIMSITYDRFRCDPHDIGIAVS